MKQITALTPKPSHERQVVVQVDGRKVATLSAARVGELQLQVQQPWTAELEARVAQAVVLDHAIKRALKFTARRARSAHEIHQRLIDEQIEPAIVEQAMSRLSQLAMLDDARLAHDLIQDWQATQHTGPNQWREKLTARGIDAAVVEQAITDATGQQDLLADAIELGRKRLATMSRLEPATQARRLFGYLARRGFDEQIVLDALSALKLGQEYDDE